MYMKIMVEKTFYITSPSVVIASEFYQYP